MTVLLLAGCGGGGGATNPSGTGGSGGGQSTVTFAIEGAPHQGTYDECTTAVNGSLLMLACSGLGLCGTDPNTGCSLSVETPAQNGSFACSTGQAGVIIWDPTLPDDGVGEHPAAAGCDSPASTPSGQPNPDCPSSSDGCNYLVGDCTVTIDSFANADMNNPGGHFSGSLTATLWSGSQSVSCAGGTSSGVQGAGTQLTISATGAW
ncbi:MAG TPA: hypothetical protein VKZ18_12610 [Polyangia bacterium]|nr:hypothetical protein [Polyangia bacterium]